MQRAAIVFCALAFLTSPLARAEGPVKLENIKQIVCDSVTHYEQDTPDQKEPARGIKIFASGSRKDMKPKPGAFLLSEFDEAEGSGLVVDDNQQYYFDPIKDGKLTFAFVADWKANGELTLAAGGRA